MLTFKLLYLFNERNTYSSKLLINNTKKYNFFILYYIYNVYTIIQCSLLFSNCTILNINYCYIINTTNIYINILTARYLTSGAPESFKNYVANVVILFNNDAHQLNTNYSKNDLYYFKYISTTS